MDAFAIVRHAADSSRFEMMGVNEDELRSCHWLQHIVFSYEEFFPVSQDTDDQRAAHFSFFHFVTFILSPMILSFTDSSQSFIETLTSVTFLFRF